MMETKRTMTTIGSDSSRRRSLALIWKQEVERGGVEPLAKHLLERVPEEAQVVLFGLTGSFGIPPRDDKHAGGAARESWTRFRRCLNSKSAAGRE